MPTRNVTADFEVFAREGESAIGAVREIHPDHLIVWIENRGDTRIEAAHIARAHDGKVLLESEGLPEELLEAIEHARDAESPPRPGAIDDD